MYSNDNCERRRSQIPTISKCCERQKQHKASLLGCLIVIEYLSLLPFINFIWWKTTSLVFPASLSSSFSPIHGMSFIPADNAWATFPPISWKGKENNKISRNCKEQQDFFQVVDTYRIKFDPHLIWFTKYVSPFWVSKNYPFTTDVLYHGWTTKEKVLKVRFCTLLLCTMGPAYNKYGWDDHTLFEQVHQPPPPPTVQWGGGW